MKNSSDIEQLITRYLLGQTTSSEDETIEGKYASDPNFLNRVEAVEDDLVDAYVRRQLSPEQNEEFERFFLASSDNRDKVHFARALIKKITPEVESLPVWQHQSLSLIAPIRAWLSRAHLSIRFASIAALTVCVIAFGLGWWVLRNRGNEEYNRHRQRTVSQNEEPPSSTANLAAPDSATITDEQPVRSAKEKSVSNSKSTPERKPTDRPVVASFILTPGLTRTAGDPNQIEIPDNAQMVEFRLSIDSNVNYKSYAASLQRIGIGEVWRRALPRMRVINTITLRMPRNLLIAGEYLLTLSGQARNGQPETVGDYAFTVTARE
ncbi:MAG TPA: hypothetical protein VJR02_18000 [Pyrinomonadaceae bacterium]|nr:hypothetical protein [Pyrinomonadaceae bacterium]